MRKVMASLVALIVTAVTANAGILFSQPSSPLNNFQIWATQNDTASFGNFATVYDNFNLSRTSSVESMTWRGGFFNPPSPGGISSFTITFWSNLAGQPGVALLSQTIAGNANQTFVGTGSGLPIYDYSLNLTTPFIANGGTDYWVSIVPNLPFPPQWGWLSGTGGDGRSYQDFFGTRSLRTNDQAFQLNGTILPEPLSVAVFGGVLAAGGLAVRRRVRATA